MNTNKKRIIAKNIVFYIFIIILATMSIGPFIWSLIKSLSPSGKVIGTCNLSSLSIDNYIFIWNEFPFSRWFLNSVIVAAIVTIGNIIINSMAGYAFARIDFPGRNILFVLTLAIMMIPSQIVLVPTYILLVKLKWINSFKGLTLPFLFNVFNVFLMRQFFLNIPKSIEESAQIDGLGRFRIFFRIVLPMSKTAIATQAILIFTANWNSFLWPSLIADRDNMYTLPVGLNSFYGQYVQFMDQVLAGVMILSIPTIIFFIIFQKYFVQGIATTGIKG